MKNKASAAAIFAGMVLEGQFDEWGWYDGADIEEMLLKSGLIERITVTKPCSDNCVCADFGFPTSCNRATKAGSAALKAYHLHEKTEMSR